VRYLVPFCCGLPNIFCRHLVSRWQVMKQRLASAVPRCLQHLLGNLRITFFALGNIRAGVASARLAAETYDLVVCDISMQGMDGLALTREIRSRPLLRTLPIILVSAHDSGDERKVGLEAGADAFLGKKECVSGRLLAEATEIMRRRRPS